MPASLKNSGFHDKNYLTSQIHNPLTFKGSQIKPGEIESAALRKHAAQRYSEIEQLLSPQTDCKLLKLFTHIYVKLN